ncbi:LIM and calponin y domains-containing protein 1 [Araneus ventricosus]|uniref:LIM and calponin y domains-containing protein 1 n=1 Tax=Araneus ventricosus TaxID=182803 RepID=A0A4Y2FVN0_ARAVE|nr:LIM and calponin y domains-containing protein 1 [Araneus ventricosus]
MPGTTRYSATFDRPYEEDERPASEPPNGSRRSRSQSWQANMGGDVRPYTPLGHNKTPPHRSSSTDSGTSSGTEHIPTRTVSKTVVKTHNNPFQFVKVASCPLYRKAEEQLKKVKEVKKPDVLKEEEEEWQTNLDSWKSRRRKMSEDVFRRQEEIRQFEQEEQSSQVAQKKIKTFSEMVESRANRGRTLSLCLISSPLELQEWDVQTNKSNSSHPFSEGSEENSAVNSEDEGVGEKRTFQNGNSLKNGSTNGCKAKANETSYADSGLESISSSHRMGDTPDSCSDFSQDSGSSIDCDSPRVSGLLLNSVNILEDFNSKSISRSNCEDSFTNSKTDSEVISEKEMDLKSASVLNEKTDSSAQEIQHVTESNANSTCADVSSDKNASESSIDSCAPKSSSNDDPENNKLERSIESENEVFVDDFEELNTQSKVYCPKAQQTSNAIPPLKPMSVLSASLKSSNFEKSSNSEKSSSDSKKPIVAVRKSGINLVKLSNAGDKLNSVTEKSNICNGTKKLNISNGTENLKSSNGAEKSTVSCDRAKATVVNCTEKLTAHKGTTKLNTTDGSKKLNTNNDVEKSSANCDPSKSSAVNSMEKSNDCKSTKKLNATNGTENLKSSNDVEKSSVGCDPAKSKTVNCTEKSKFFKGTKKLSTTNDTQNLKSNNDVPKSSGSCDPAKPSVLNCMEKSVTNSAEKLRTASAKEKSKITPETQETSSVSSTKNLKNSCDAEKLGTNDSIVELKNSEKFKTDKCSEKSNTSTERKNNSSIEKPNNNVNAKKPIPGSNSAEKVDNDKKTPTSESQNEEGISVAVDEEKPKVHSEEGETKKPKNVIRRKKKRATAKIVSMEITNEKMNSPENRKEPAVSSPRVSDESLNIVFQSQSSKNKDSVGGMKTSTPNSAEKVILNDVPPVEKIAEEMEKLILQQLEEEERAKEMSSKLPTSDLFGSPEHNLIAPPKMAEPPKEKPPPPPVVENDAPKTTALKRVNSTKRIKKELHKRMSNFLGIEADENGICDESSVPPPPALEQILKVEVELEKENRKRLESAAEERLRLEETEIIEKEQEIIANLETEERQRQLFNNAEICDFMQDEDRIQKLKEERKKMESERILAETQRLRLEEEKQLREREKFIRQQEAGNAPSAEISAPVLSDAEKLSNNAKSPNASSLCLDTKPNVSLSSIGGEGKTISNSTSQQMSEIKEKPTVPAKPEVPPKPLKKKEAIRKERERLRQEQEALQREREEHRLKLLKEQDELLKNNPKPYAPNAPATRLGPISPLKPAYNPQLTNRIGPQPSTRENVIYTSQSYPGTQNGISGTSGCVEPVLNKQSKPVSSHKKVVQNDAWVQPKVSPVKKQTLESSPESKYNQNHWLIQEAEMRRIAELKERQHSTHYPIPQTHLAEDDVCSTSPRAPPTMLMSPPLQEKVWNYGHSNMPVKKYPPPASAEKPVGLYPVPPQPPAKPSRVVPMERPEHMLSVSGRKRCSHCSEELGRGAAMIIESLQLYYHIHCFQCCVCQAQLGNGSCGTDVRVRNNKLHCHNCYSNDEAGLKFSQV